MLVSGTSLMCVQQRQRNDSRAHTKYHVKHSGSNYLAFTGSKHYQYFCKGDAMNLKLADFKMMETRSPNGVQVILRFGGKYDLSIVQNELSYGNKQGLYEIAVFDDVNQVELPGITADGAAVKGWLTEKDVDNIIKKMYTVTKEIPVQV